ncbi:MAG: DUF3524 domain-containing protein [Marinobacter sp.]|nr:DUF3524 domain-containing protein [Marinobacter sp.]
MSQPRPRILLLSAYEAGSHVRWRELLVSGLPEYEWHTLTLPARYFRWRIRGNPLSWLGAPELQESWDLVIATSMVDLATLKGLNPRLANTPTLLYMHENQFAFPDSGRQHASIDPQMVNLYSALAADRVAFNSAWNRDSMLAGIDALLSRLPDAVPPGLVDALVAKSCILPVPIADRLFSASERSLNSDCPHILWNHRWEYDKGPERLQALLEALVKRQQPFRLSVVGERFRSYPPVFDRIQAQFQGQLQHWGYLESRAAYEALLQQADVVVSTALHDFQGLAMLEALAAGCMPLAPDRLAYPEYVPEICRYTGCEQAINAEAEAAADVLQQLLITPPDFERPWAWQTSALIPRYRALLESMI